MQHLHKRPAKPCREPLRVRCVSLSEHARDSPGREAGDDGAVVRIGPSPSVLQLRSFPDCRSYVDSPRGRDLLRTPSRTGSKLTRLRGGLLRCCPVWPPVSRHCLARSEGLLLSSCLLWRCSESTWRRLGTLVVARARAFPSAFGSGCDCLASSARSLSSDSCSSSVSS